MTAPAEIPCKGVQRIVVGKNVKSWGVCPGTLRNTETQNQGQYVYQCDTCYRQTRSWPVSK